MHMKLFFIFVLLFALYSSEYVYNVYQANGNNCNSVNIDECYNCGNGYFYFYPFDDLVGYYNYSSGCFSGTYETGYGREQSCTPSSDCSVYYSSSYIEHKLNIQSTNPLTASFITSPHEVFLTLTEYNATVMGDVSHVFFENNGYLFQVIKTLTSTEYLCNFGIREFNTQYSDSFFTYTLEKNILNEKPAHPFKNEINSVIVDFIPFTNAQVAYGSNKEYYIGYSDFELFVYLSNIEDINDLNVANPFFRLTNLDIYPPYDSYDNGQLVFQFQSRSNYHFYPCYYSKSIVDIYECEFSLSFSSIPLPFRDFSFSLSGSFFDSSRVFGQNTNADEMVFQLF